MRRSWWLRASMLALLVMGCDGVGRELVDEARSQERELMCVASPPCAKIVDWVPPARVLPSTPARTAACRSPESKLVEGAGDLSELSCARWSLPLSATPRVLRGLALHEVELSISAEQPAHITLAASTLSATRIALRGPIALHIREDTVLDNVQIVDLGEAAPTLELVESNARGLLVSGTHGAFAGRVVVTRSTLSRAQLFARELTIEDTVLSSIDIASDVLIALGVYGQTLNLELVRGSIASSELEGFRVHRCDTLHVRSSTLTAVSLAPCREPLRLNRCDVFGGAAAGRIESKLTMWSGVSFGVDHHTELELWSGSFKANTLCGSTERVALAAEAHCNECESLSAAALQGACRARDSEEPADAGAAPFADANPRCPALDLAPPCAPEPVDEYPL